MVKREQADRELARQSSLGVTASCFATWVTYPLPPCSSRYRRQQQQRPPGGGGGDRKTQNLQQQQSPQQKPPSNQQQQPVNQQQNDQQQPGPGGNARHPRDQQQQGGQCGGSHGQQFQGHDGQHQGPPHHGYSQNRRWHHNQQGQGGGQGLRVQGGPAGDRDRGATPTGDGDKGAPPRKTKETENVKAAEAITRLEPESSRGPNEGPPSQPGGQGGPKVSLLPSSKERLRRRLKDKEEAIVSPVGPQRSRMDRLLEILNSMRNNSAGVDGQLSSFMEEAQTSAQSEESLAQIVSTIYGKALSDRSFAATAARLCDKMALFMVEGTKFRSLLLNTLQAVCDVGKMSVGTELMNSLGGHSLWGGDVCLASPQIMFLPTHVCPAHTTAQCLPGCHDFPPSFGSQTDAPLQTQSGR
ncbi:unnamed protein product [Coregonus sp. 'balchen']|nr:unnamed protein product [Coregonus sp. 'balchen']